MRARWRTQVSASIPDGTSNAAWTNIRMEASPPNCTSLSPTFALRVGPSTGRICMNQWMATWARVMKPRSLRR